MRPEEQIRLNVQRALGKQQTQPVKKQNVFVSGVLKSASKTRSTDIAEIIEICEGLPGISDPTAAALCLICCHNNTQIRKRALQNPNGDDPGAITPEQISLATGEEFSALDFANIITELMQIGVLDFDDDGFYRVTLYSE